MLRNSWRGADEEGRKSQTMIMPLLTLFTLCLRPPHPSPASSSASSLALHHVKCNDQDWHSTIVSVYPLPNLLLILTMATLSGNTGKKPVVMKEKGPGVDVLVTGVGSSVTWQVGFLDNRPRFGN